jgi:NAD+ diphosphatase
LHSSHLKSLLDSLPATTLAASPRARSSCSSSTVRTASAAQCGAPTALSHPDPRGTRRCSAADCGREHYPRVSPVVIVAVERGSEILLGRSPHFPPGLYSALAGFVDAGESAEQAVHREIHEETGLRIGALRYFASQAWPFPHALMLGYQAEYEGRRDRLRALARSRTRASSTSMRCRAVFPSRYAMANQLLRDFCLRHGRPWPPAWPERPARRGSGSCISGGAPALRRARRVRPIGLEHEQAARRRPAIIAAANHSPPA